MDGFRADPEVLNSGASSILKSLNPAADIDLEGLSKDSGAVGHSGLSEEFARFSTTWQIAYLILRSRANSAVEMLNAMADNYARSDTDAGHLLSPHRAGLM
jgi:hypothetical protein